MTPDNTSFSKDDQQFGLNDPAPNDGSLPAQHGHGGSGGKSGYAALVLGALGVVYGDIGTSPLYALRETINAAISGHIGSHGGQGGALVQTVPRDVVIGVLSLILWSLCLLYTSPSPRDRG